MAIPEKTIITIKASIHAPVEKVWNLLTDPNHIIHWNFASDDWYAPKAENDLRVGGRFLSRMEAKDGSSGFDYTGEYSKVEQHRQIEYTIDDGRIVKILFIPKGNETSVIEIFEAEQTNTIEMQQKGWQAILDSFKKYVEGYDRFEPMHFEISIDAKVEKVYKAMFDEKLYSEWTSEFNPASHFIGSWEKNSKILFLGTDKDGRIGGMVSKIRENIPNKFVSLEHIGIVQNGKEITNGPQANSWTGALENYSFNEVNGKTLVSVDADSTKEFKSYFIRTWPGALKKLKVICEK